MPLFHPKPQTLNPIPKPETLNSNVSRAGWPSFLVRRRRAGFVLHCCPLGVTGGRGGLSIKGHVQKFADLHAQTHPEAGPPSQESLGLNMEFNQVGL